MCNSRSAHAHTSRPEHVKQPTQIYRLKVGDALITAISDGTLQLNAPKVLHGADTSVIEAYLERSFLAHDIETSINVYLIELDDRKMLVDTGAGEWFGVGVGGRMLENLKVAGVEPEQITDLLVTHTHADHTGGMVRRGERVFPNAVVHIAQADIDFFLDPNQANLDSYKREEMPDIFDQIKQTMGPYAQAGQVRTFDRATEVVPGVTATLHPGHTPGSACYTLVSAGHTIVFIGDMVHVEAVQFSSPEVFIDYDVDGVEAAASRTAAFADLAERRVLVAGPHIRYPGIGHIRAEGQGYAWVPEVFGDKQVD